MEEKHKKILEKQLTLLSERSQTLTSAKELQILTGKMIDLVRLLDPELRIQFFDEELSNLPAATLKMSDLEEIAAARKEKSRLFADHLRQIQKEVAAQSIQ